MKKNKRKTKATVSQNFTKPIQAPQKSVKIKYTIFLQCKCIFSSISNSTGVLLLVVVLVVVVVLVLVVVLVFLHHLILVLNILLLLLNV